MVLSQDGCSSAQGWRAWWAEGQLASPQAGLPYVGLSLYVLCGNLWLGFPGPLWSLSNFPRGIKAPELACNSSYGWMCSVLKKQMLGANQLVFGLLWQDCRAEKKKEHLCSRCSAANFRENQPLTPPLPPPSAWSSPGCAPVKHAIPSAHRIPRSPPDGF